eukprot:CAMPEP_0171206910 /NCGR_PEP_ID=MMETSP0790-20130122/27304_1 /TAXON_ID=2925 /ORGANISM="Alexandrium catenella, Strain OF101" /LENGTH=154 /DNA_ID=CAMNT_0011672465 /DNA_START=206 /DNA_END=666 /DNA_ORIENTATION=+
MRAGFPGEGAPPPHPSLVLDLTVACPHANWQASKQAGRRAGLRAGMPARTAATPKQGKKEQNEAWSADQRTSSSSSPLRRLLRPVAGRAASSQLPRARAPLPQRVRAEAAGRTDSKGPASQPCSRPAGRRAGRQAQKATPRAQGGRAGKQASTT